MKDKAATAHLLEAQAGEFLTAGFDDLEVQVYGDTAIAKYRDVSQMRVQGETVKKQMRFTNIWTRRANGNWQIVAEHSSVIKPAELLPRHPLAERLAQK